jgi:hypothetical protein
MEDYLGTYEFNEDAPCYILDASNKVKFSFHFKFDILLENYEDSVIFHKKFIEYCNNMYTDHPDYHNFHKYIDPNVYTKNRLIRLPNQSKFGQDRPLKVFSGSMNVEEHILTNIKKSDKPITIPAPWKKIYNNKYRIIKSIPTKTIQEFNEDEELVWLVKHTLHKREKYNDWIKVIWACIGAGIPIELIHDADYKACPEKYNEDATNEIIKRYKEGKGLGKHSLIKWAAEAGYYMNREVEKKSPTLSINKEDHLTWIDLLKKYHGKTFENFRELIEQIRDDASLVVSMIQGKDTIFTVYSNDDNPYDLTKSLCKLTLNYKKQISDSKIIIETTTLEKLMKDFPLEFPLYNKLVFKPNNFGLKKNERNTFLGFEAQIKDNYSLEYIQPLLDHIKNILSNGNEDYYKYIMSWFAKIVKTPYKPTDIFLLFNGEQGTGKTIIAEFLVKYVFGKNLSLSTSGINSLVSRFNGSIKSKLFVCCNELTNLDSTKGGFNGAFDKMKNLITDRLIQIEHKGFEHMQIDNFCNFMGTTNHEFTAKLERGDRRYAVFTVSDKRKGDYDYFDKLGECLDKEGGNHFYNYLLNYPEEEMIDLRRIPETEIRKTMIENSKDQVVRFIDELLQGDLIEKEEWLDIENKKIGMSDLYLHYRNWCCVNGETKTASSNIFSRKIPKNLVCDKGKNRINKKQIKWIKFL